MHQDDAPPPVVATTRELGRKAVVYERSSLHKAKHHTKANRCYYEDIDTNNDCQEYRREGSSRRSRHGKRLLWSPYSG